ncbi:uncharacterized protein [Asterias amurensis]|uniref:uncharacterized protein n=1 Tax=Asterias amurensis TaxID=7602 RepID=UPI003AB65458
MAGYVRTAELLADWICSHLGYQFSVGATAVPKNSSSGTLCQYSSCQPLYGEDDQGLNFFECLDENTLSVCPSEWNGTVVNVICAPESNIVPLNTTLEFRLAAVTNESHTGIIEGRFSRSSWKTVCTRVWHTWQVTSTADTACRQLGYPWAAAFELVRYSEESSGYIGSGDDLIMRELFLGKPDSLRWTTGDNSCQILDYELVFVECETGTRLFGLTIFPCPTQSCRGRCGTPATKTTCGCDAACSQCSDCCYDFNQRCPLQEVTDDHKRIFKNSLIGSTSCKLFYGSVDRVLVIDGCPPDWNDTTVAMQCADDSLGDPLQYDYGPFFQNEFCATCHGITANVNNSEYVWEGSHYGMDTECSLDVSAEIQMGCRAYTSIVVFDGILYKNHHCAYCNGWNSSFDVDYCIHTRTSVAPGHLEVLLGRQPDLWVPEISVSLLSQDQIHCYDKETQLSIHTEGMNSTNDINWFLFGWLVNDVTSCYLHTLGWQNVQLTWPFFDSYISNNGTADLTTGDGTYILTTQYLTNTTEFEDMLDQTLTVTPSIIIEESARHWITQCGIERVDFVEVCGTSMGQIQPACTENIYNTDNTTMRAFNISGNQIIYIGGGLLIEASSVSLVRTYTYQLVPTTDKVSRIVVCGHEANSTNCHTPLIAETKLGSSTDGDPQIIYKGREFQQDEVTYLPDGHILICSEFLATYGEPFISFSDPLTVLNTVGYSLSIAALFATLVNYIAFACLRNVPGGAIMSLTSALFTAQLMTLTVLDKAENQAFCVAMAVLLHFMWMSTFTWMNVLAFDLVRTFTSQQVLNPNNKKIFLTYCLYGWGVPLLIVSACLAAHHANGVEFKYGGLRSCWLVGRYAVFVAFGVPLAVSLVANAVLFGLTVHSVHATLKAASMVRKGKSKAKETTTELWIYLKISCIMGFTWTFGCLGAFVDHQAVWYLFIITNSLQGVFIFISFGCNARIRGLWRDKLGHKPVMKDSNSKRTNSSSISSVTNNRTATVTV